MTFAAAPAPHRLLVVAGGATIAALVLIRRRKLLQAVAIPLAQSLCLLRDRLFGPPPPPPRSISDYGRLADRRLSQVGRHYYGFVDGEGTTLRNTRAAFDAVRLMPRIMRGIGSDVSTGVTLFGAHLELPVLVAPTAFHNWATPEGEVATARGAGAAGAGYCYNWMLSSKLYCEVVAEPGVKWLHLYIFEEREIVARSIELAAATGSFSAIVLTCDHPHTRVQEQMVPYFQQRWMDLDLSEQAMGALMLPNQAAAGEAPLTLGDALSQPGAKVGGTNDAALGWVRGALP